MYGYGYRYNSGLVIGAGGGAPFANTKSILFDGVDDNLYIGTALNLGINSTISLWVKLDTGFFGVLLGENTYPNDYLLYCAEGSAFYIRIAGVVGNYVLMWHQPSGGIVSGVWNNIVVQRTGDSIEAFLNGVSGGTKTGFGTVTDTMFDTVGAKPTGALAIGGVIDEIAVWNNSTVNPVDIYNLGTPTDLSLLATPPISWWRNGDGDTYPTITDNGSGGNNGTMTNMDAGDIVTDVPL